MECVAETELSFLVVKINIIFTSLQFYLLSGRIIAVRFAKTIKQIDFYIAGKKTGHYRHQYVLPVW